MKNKFLILVIDDSEVIIDRLVPALQELSRIERIIVGRSYEEGRNLFENNHFDVAILDINLQGRSGIELLRLIKRNNYPVKKIIMMTDDPSEEKMKVCEELGADYFINKFTDFESIVDIIHSLDSDLPGKQ